MTPEQETRLISAIAAAFGDQNFDTMRIIHAANIKSTELADAIDAAVPNCRYRSGYMRSRFRYVALRRALEPLSAKHFTTDHVGWWYIRPENN